ncbi:MAG: substrate-binding and VWA domain-containing protein [Microthrixaceae bacterium]|nr:substrate-binding and VWA domain-containing protein [Microthrixaceae bacterium]
MPNSMMLARVRPRLLVVLLCAAAAIAAACGGGDDDPFAGGGATGNTGIDPDCVVVDAAVSSEKIDLLTQLAEDFNASGAEVDGTCVGVRVRSKASGAAATALAEGWDDQADGGPAPVLWSPASSAWGEVLNQRLVDSGQSPMAAEDPTPFMLTPLVIAMPQPMAEALGWPDTPVGWSEILTLARDPQGWASVGHPEWGPFRLGKTNPNFSTSGLSALIAQNYAATGGSDELTLEDLSRPEVQQFGADIESAVVHYGDITMTFLDNWFRADQRGTALTYASAVAVEEKSVIDYNRGNPDGVLEPGEEERPPRIPLVAIYPTEGTLYSDNPLYVLDGDWVDADEKAGAELFTEYVSEPENQEKVLEFGFRPGNPEVALGPPIDVANGVDPDQPQTLLDVPDGPVLVALLDAWAQQRKTARVLMVLDVSGSMGELADPGNPDAGSKLDLAVRAVREGLEEFKSDDLVGLRIFTTDLGGSSDATSSDTTSSYEDLSPIERVGDNRERLSSQVSTLIPLNGTPLYEVVGDSHAQMVDDYDPAMINAVVVLTDGMNDDGDPADDDSQLASLIEELNRTSDGENATPVRVFTIAYGTDADVGALEQMSEASNATAYTASDATTIGEVFTAVVSNF